MHYLAASSDTVRGAAAPAAPDALAALARHSGHKRIGSHGKGHLTHRAPASSRAQIHWVRAAG
jgi:hypothetical protein